MKVTKVTMDLYKRGEGVLNTFPDVKTEDEAKEFISNYCKEHSIKLVAREWCGDEHWNYLSDGTEIDYCIHRETE